MKKYYHSLARAVLVLCCWCAVFGTRAQPVPTYRVAGNRILKNDVPTVWRGANALHVFGGDQASREQMSTWNIDIVREFIGTLRQQPVAGTHPVAVYVNGAPSPSYLRPLELLAQTNRAHGKITIFCPFGWNPTPAETFVGLTPSQTPFWNEYKAKMREIATFFRDQPDVWLEVWNEPYWWDRSHGYSDELWRADMQQMVDNIRSTGNQNIVLVPGAESGQDDQVLLAQGAALLQSQHNKNVVFDLHAYENWLHESQATVESRIRAVQQRGLAVLFGEVGPHNASTLMNPVPFLQAVRTTRTSTCAWLWKADENDTDALLRSDGTTPNDQQNNTWGSTFRAFTRENHNPPSSFSGVYRVVARHSGKVLDVPGGSWATATGVQQWTYHGGANQHWQVTALPDGSYTLTAQHSGKCLEVSSSTADGAKVQQGDKNGTPAQRWHIDATTDGYSQLRNVASGKALDASGGSAATGDGVAAIQWTATGGTNQQWRLEPVASAGGAARATPSAAGAPALAAPSWQVYPNPGSPEQPATLAFSAGQAQEVTVSVHNAQGHLVRRFTVPAPAGRTTYRLPAVLPVGLYYLRATIDQQPQRFTLQVK
ncbi:RICIN domain-containing protein [Hymenobacter terrenus]|uniref:RICIN domain-containing protein n=1 Tax=Hymenobacter terrenus TaxID=1629124 RepID=UPI0006991E6B|nr:RICIN domain-containing protein [Hymenobacter terrenus]